MLAANGRSPLEFSARGFGCDPEAEGCFLGISIDQDAASSLLQGLGHGLADAELTFIRLNIVGGAKPVQVVVKESLGSLDQLLEGRPALLFDKAIWVVGRGHRRYADG